MNEHEVDFIIVIRSAGERTLGVCEELIRNEIGDRAECITIECSPFEEAIKKSFKIGIESGKKWLVTVDADVLIRKGGITDLLKIGNNLPKKIFQYEGFLYDGLLLKYRQGGVKVYRSNLLAEAIKRIPEPGTQIRPETFTQDQMAELGYKRTTVNEIVGLHDFEQYSKDVYRKVYVHARKYKNQVYGLIPIWKHLQKKGKREYGIAVKAGMEGINSKEKITLDSIELRKRFKGSELNNGSFSINKVEYLNLIIEKKTSIEFNEKLLSHKYQFFEYVRNFGLWVAILWFLGRLKHKLIKNKS